MKHVKKMACALVALTSVTCSADVVRFAGPYTWYREFCIAGGAPPASSLFDISRAADDQPTPADPNRAFFHLYCMNLGSCQLSTLSIYGPGILRATAGTPITICGNTMDAHLAQRLALGDSVGPAAMTGSTWQTTADHGGALGATPRHLLELPAYIGVRFREGADWHYGWIRLESFGYQQPGGFAAYVVSDWAYETQPNTAIIVGAPATPCPCEFDALPGITSQDFFDFVNCFLTGICDADVNDDNDVTSQDFFDFLTCFFAPSPSCL